MGDQPRILLIDDKENIRTVVAELLRNEGWSVTTATNGRDGLAAAVRDEPDIIVSDIRMDDIDGIELFHMLRARGFSIPFIFVTAYGSVEEAVAMLREGAIHYLTKPVNHDELKVTIRSILRSGPPVGDMRSRRLIGTSDPMERVYGRIAALARSASTVLITGESGTGKELIARAIHEQGERGHNRFVPVNCSTFSSTLLESELFGYEKGAFTGAERRKIGFFEFADSGTLFLDEVSELSPSTQAALLRVLQERVIRRVGGTDTVPVDVRLIAATNRDLHSLVRSGGFRQDLYYRLNVVPVEVPPLRERLEDLEALVKHFVTRVASREGLGDVRIQPSFHEPLKSYPWPGNVRELENLIERLLVVHRPHELTPELAVIELPSTIDVRAHRPASPPDERQRIIGALIAAEGNRTRAAEMLGLPRRTLYNRLARLKITEKDLTP